MGCKGIGKQSAVQQAIDCGRRVGEPTLRGVARGAEFARNRIRRSPGVPAVTDEGQDGGIVGRCVGLCGFGPALPGGRREVAALGRDAPSNVPRRLAAFRALSCGAYFAGLLFSDCPPQYEAGNDRPRALLAQLKGTPLSISPLMKWTLRANRSNLARTKVARPLWVLGDAPSQLGTVAKRFPVSTARDSAITSPRPLAYPSNRFAPVRRAQDHFGPVSGC